MDSHGLKDLPTAASTAIRRDALVTVTAGVIGEIAAAGDAVRGISSEEKLVTDTSTAPIHYRVPEDGETYTVKANAAVTAAEIGNVYNADAVEVDVAGGVQATGNVQVTGLADTVGAQNYCVVKIVKLS